MCAFLRNESLTLLLLRATPGKQVFLRIDCLGDGCFSSRKDKEAETARKHCLNQPSDTLLRNTEPVVWKKSLLRRDSVGCQFLDPPSEDLFLMSARWGSSHLENAFSIGYADIIRFKIGRKGRCGAAAFSAPMREPRCSQASASRRRSTMLCFAA